MLEFEVLVGELLTVNRFAAGPVERGEVTTLDHELLDHAVENGACVQLVSECLTTGDRGGRGSTHPYRSMVCLEYQCPSRLYTELENSRQSSGRLFASGVSELHRIRSGAGCHGRTIVELCEDATKLVPSSKAMDSSGKAHQFKCNATSLVVANLDVKEDAWTLCELWSAT